MKDNKIVGTFCEKCRMPMCICNNNVVYGRNSAVVHADLKNIPFPKAEPKLTWDDIIDKFIHDEDMQFPFWYKLQEFLKRDYEPPKPIKK